MKNQLPGNIKKIIEDKIEDYVKVQIELHVSKTENMLANLSGRFQELLESSERRYDAILKEIQKVAEASAPMREWYRDMSVVKKLFMWGLLVTGALIAVWTGLRDIIFGK